LHFALNAKEKIMLKNYFKVAFRTLVKHRIYSFINIAGLALGMGCCILILLWVQDELSFDRFHEKKDRLYLCVNKLDDGWSATSPWMLAPTLKNDFPEIEKSTRYTNKDLLVNYSDKRFFESIGFVDPDFLQMFSFPLIEGDPASALTAKSSVVISEQTAQKYFKGTTPIGKILQINQNMNFTVTGVMKDVPSNSTLQFDLLVPVQNIGEDLISTWFWETSAFVLLKEHVSVNDVRTKIAGTSQKYDKRVLNKFLINDLQLYVRGHLYGLNTTGSILYIVIFSGIAIIVLLVACMNFINLFTARSSVRGKEIGIRKVVGAGKKHIVLQFYGETLLISLIAFLLALVFVMLVLPSFNLFSEKQLSLNFVANPLPLLGSILIILFTTIFAGSYPALLLSTFHPIRIMSSTGSKKSTIRWMLVGIQFAVSMVMIVLTITMNRQLDYIQNKDLGFNREQVISIPLNDEFRKQYNVIKNRLLQCPGIIRVTSGTSSPNSIGNVNPVSWEGRNPNQFEYFNYVSVDYDYFETFEMEFAEGRPFSREFPTDRQNYIVNEAAIKFMKMDSPIGKMFSIWYNQGKIIGVVKNFNSRSLHDQIVPVVLTFNQYVQMNTAFVRVDPHNIISTIAVIEKTWKEFIPNYPFQYEFLDDMFRRQYTDDEKIRTLVQCFSGLAIFISSIGLFGLATFTAQRRTKEIGIRKVAGATIFNIVIFMLIDFFKWLVVATIVAVPIAYYALNKWLQNFAYRIEVTWWIFAVAGGIILLIALFTVSWQAIRAATVNPVEALRYE
jgi:putative ABC transport system permease protein